MLLLRLFEIYTKAAFHGDKIMEIGIIGEIQVKLSVATRLKSRGQEPKFFEVW